MDPFGLWRLKRRREPLVIHSSGMVSDYITAHIRKGRHWSHNCFVQSDKTQWTWAAGWERGGASNVRFEPDSQSGSVSERRSSAGELDSFRRLGLTRIRCLSEPEIHLCSALLPEPLSDLFTLRVKPRILRAAERICLFAVQAQDKEGKLWAEPSSVKETEPLLHTFIQLEVK